MTRVDLFRRLCLHLVSKRAVLSHSKEAVEHTQQARRVLDSMASRNARWYYLSSLANQGLGKSIDALQDARRAVQMDPNNTEYQMHLRQMQNPGQTYRTQTTYTQSGGVTQWCWNLILLNLLCNCCCGGRMFFRPLFCF